MILAIDTSARSGSIALVEDGLLRSERTVAHAGPHARWLLKNIVELCAHSELALHEIDLYAVAMGPGSFTGLRIGITTIKALAWSNNKPVAGISTLEALALNVPFSAMPVCPILDARKSEVYAALYECGGSGLRSVMEPAALRPEVLLELIEGLYPAPAPILFTGPGLAVYGEFIEKNRRGVVLAAEPLWHVRASNIAALAARKDALKVPPITLAPFYLRKSEAELRLKASALKTTP